MTVPPNPERKFEVTLEQDTFTEEKYALFENYQRIVHREPPKSITKRGFRRFLCESPLKRKTRDLNGREQKLGSYHQCYRLDGRLIAMGVLDLLPHCVSAVYFIYHDDFGKWSFGKLSALREVTLALEGDYKYYYMGYYIHSCAKMRYKADYKPQHVLDPVSLEWSELDEDLKSKMAEHVLASRSKEGNQQTPNSGNLEDDEQTSDYAQVLETAADAEAAMNELGISFFKIGMPGVMSLEELLKEVNLDEIRVSLRGYQAMTKVKIYFVFKHHESFCS